MTYATAYARAIRNWPVHNLLAHPLSEVAYWLARPWGRATAERVAGRIHDATLPRDAQNGRG